MYRFFCILLISASLIGCSSKTPDPYTIRVATFNIENLSLEKVSEVDENGNGINEQLKAAAKILVEKNPNIIILNEVDFTQAADLYSKKDALSGFQSYFFAPILFEVNDINPAFYDGTLGLYSRYSAQSNTGILSGHDFDNNGTIATEADINTRTHGGDAFGYGEYPGQYGMAVLSNYPIDWENVRTFQNFLWKDMPDSHMPTDWYDEEEQAIFRLSSKSHWDIPIKINSKGDVIHLFVSHPTPPVFDGPEDRNGRRNFDEVRFWAEYLNDSPAIYDDQGVQGGYNSDAPFIIAGDLNASVTSDPIYTGEIAINQLLDHPKIVDHREIFTSEGGLAGREPGPPNYWENATASFLDGFRADYLLFSKNLNVVDGGVVWPSEEKDPEGHQNVTKASDHRMVWADILIEN